MTTRNHQRTTQRIAEESCYFPARWRDTIKHALASVVSQLLATTVPISLKQFRKQLVSSGLMSSEDLAAFTSTIASPPVRAEEFAKGLIEAGRLTKFQAKMIAAGQAQQLVLDRYVIKDEIGSGGMGQVYLAEHSRMERDVAIKVLPSELVKNQESIERFHREVKAVARLSHPNIVTAHDANEHNGTHFLVMEYVRGQNLYSTVKENGPLSVDLALNLIRQAAEGLAYAHSQGVIHRDIKPANLLLDESGVVKILDLGLARTQMSGNASAELELTGSGMVMGTVDYMAPEQALDSRLADVRSDIYSLGCSLFYLLTGRSLFDEETVMKKLLALQNAEPPSLNEYRHDLLPDVEELYWNMIARDPAERCQSMGEVVSAIERCPSQDGAAAEDELMTADPALQEFLRNQSLRESATIIQKTDQGQDRDAPANTQAFSANVLGNTDQFAAAARPLQHRGNNSKSRGPFLKFALGGGLIATLVAWAIIAMTASDGTPTSTRTDHDPQVQDEAARNAEQPASPQPAPTEWPDERIVGEQLLALGGGDHDQNVEREFTSGQRRRETPR